MTGGRRSGRRCGIRCSAQLLHRLSGRALAGGVRGLGQWIGGADNGSAGRRKRLRVASAAFPRRSLTAATTGQWGADGDQGRVQGVDALEATGLEATDLGALLGAAVDAPVGGVDVDERHLAGAGAGQKRRGAGEVGSDGVRALISRP